MRRFLEVLILLTSFISFSQNTFRLKHNFTSEPVRINGVNYEVDSSGFLEIQTNYPGFDTLTFLRFGNHPILCNFKPDSSYVVFMACCGSSDVVSYNKFENFKRDCFGFESEFLVLDAQDYLLDSPQISLRIKSQTKDTIYGWNADYACSSKFKRMTTQSWDYGTPMKCFYWSNINRFEFFTSGRNYLEEANKEGVVEDIFREIGFGDEKEDPVLGAVAVRLFDNHHFEIIFDPISHEVTIEYVE